MEVVTLLLLVVALLKVVSIVQAIRWLRSRGRSYEVYLRNHPPADEPSYYDAFEKCGGRHFPFGVKDYRLRRYMRSGRNARGWRRLATGIVSLFQATLYRYERLALLVGLWAVALISIRHDVWLLTSNTWHASMLYMLTAVVLATNALLSVEAVFSYGTLGGYATPFHMLSRGVADTRLLLELRVVIGKVMTTVFSGAVAAYVAYIAFDALEGKALVARTSWECVGRRRGISTDAVLGYDDICHRWLRRHRAIQWIWSVRRVSYRSPGIRCACDRILLLVCIQGDVRMKDARRGARMMPNKAVEQTAGSVTGGADESRLLSGAAAP